MECLLGVQLGLRDEALLVLVLLDELLVVKVSSMPIMFGSKADIVQRASLSAIKCSKKCLMSDYKCLL